MPGSEAPTVSEKGEAFFKAWKKKDCKEEMVHQ